jgi:hypothetical protein
MYNEPAGENKTDAGQHERSDLERSIRESQATLDQLRRVCDWSSLNDALMLLESNKRTFLSFFFLFFFFPIFFFFKHVLSLV